MRIAWVSFSFGEYCVRHVNAFAEEHETLLVMPSENLAGPARETLPQVQLLTFPRPRLRHPHHQFVSIRKILRRIREFQPDVVHFQYGHLWFNFALPLLRAYPLVITIHDPRHHEGDSISRKTPQWVLDFGFRRANRVIVHGRELARVVNDEIGIPVERISVIPHIAIGQTDTAAAPVEEEDKTVLFFGRIWEYKGLEYLIKAEPLIAEKVPDVRIIIAGRGEDFERYRRLMTIPDRYEIHNNWIEDRDRTVLFQKSAVVVLPYISATGSGVIPVAYAWAKPVVATHVGAIPEYVEDGKTGLLVPPRNERALADAIIALLRDTEKRRRMGRNAHIKLNQEWSPQEVARRTTEVYEQTIREFSAC